MDSLYHHIAPIGYLASNGAQPNVDGFARLNTATPVSIFQTFPAFTPQFETIDYHSTGTGTVFVDLSNTAILHTVSTTGDRVIRQSREYLLYQPGKLQTSFFTFTPHYNGTFDNSVTVRVGIFDDYRDKNTSGSVNPGTGVEVNQKSMGHFFEISGNSWFVCERANSSDNITNITRISQSNWNLDTLNGNASTSPSGLILAPSKRLPVLCVIDRQWLGVGIVRMGFSMNGKIVYCHIFHQRGYQVPYTHLPKLPLRWEIEKVEGGADSFAQMASICGTVQILGDYIPFGNIFSLPSPLVATSLNVSTTMKALICIRLQQKYCRATFKLKDIDLYCSGDGMYTVYKNATFTGGTPTFTALQDVRSMIEYSVLTANSPITVSGGTPLRSGFFSKLTAAGDSLGIAELITASSFCSNIHGVCDILVLAVQSFSGNITVHGNLRWIEIV